MPGIDLLISRYLAQEIKNNLKPNFLKKVEQDLFFIHGMSIKLSIENFETFHNLLRQNLEIDVNAFEKSCIDKIISVSRTNNEYLITLKNSKLSNKIFNYLGDDESRKLLSCIMGNNLTIPEILSETKILKSPAYRKIENMLLDGLILESGKILSNNKRVSQYRCLFKEFQSIIGKNKFQIILAIDKKDLEESSVFKFGVLDI